MSPAFGGMIKFEVSCWKQFLPNNALGGRGILPRKLPPPAHGIFGIEGKDFSEGFNLSSEVKTLAVRILQKVFINSTPGDKFKLKDYTLNCS